MPALLTKQALQTLEKQDTTLREKTAPQSQLALLTRQIENSPVRRSLIPEEHRLSLWVPIQKRAAGSGEASRAESTTTYLTAFFYESPVMQITETKPRPVYRPGAQITVEPTRGKIVAFSSGHSQFAPQIQPERIEGQQEGVVGLVYPKDAPARDISSLQGLYARLYQGYDVVLKNLFKPADQMSAAEKADITDFKTVFKRLIEPGLNEFYRQLNPEFFDWLDSITA